MSDQHLGKYLDDHAAGAVAAMQLIDRLNAADAGLGCFLEALRADIEADYGTILDLIARQLGHASRPRRAAAWLAEKMVQLKLRLDDPKHGPLYLLEAVEAIGLGIDGKRAMWEALAAVADDTPSLDGIDFDRLIERADEQRRRVEMIRLEAAHAALEPDLVAAHSI
jgi:hypothetical protein